MNLSQVSPLSLFQITLIMEDGIKPGDPEVTSALQVARFKFFGTVSHKRKKPAPKLPPKPTVVSIAIPVSQNRSLLFISLCLYIFVLNGASLCRLSFN